MLVLFWKGANLRATQNLPPNDPLHSEYVPYFRPRICMLVVRSTVGEATNEATAASL